MKQFVLDANKVILASSETTDKVDEVRFEPNEVYTVDIAVTKGEGKTRAMDARPTVYRRNVEETYMLKMKASRAVLSEVDARYPVFPFSVKWACGAGLMNGVGGSVIAPQSGATRAQTAKMLELLSKLMQK